VKKDSSPIILEWIFGSNSTGSTPAERAATSSRMFVRSLAQVAPDSDMATGRRITASEALAICGWPLLSQIPDKGSSLTAIGCVGAKTKLKAAREDLGLSPLDVANRSGLTIEEVFEIEDHRMPGPIANAEKMAMALGLSILDI